MCGVYREAGFSQKIFTNELNLSLPRQARVKKTFHGVETHWLSSKEKVPDVFFNKEVDTDSVLGHERISDYWFSWK